MNNEVALKKQMKIELNDVVFDCIHFSLGEVLGFAGRRGWKLHSSDHKLWRVDAVGLTMSHPFTAFEHVTSVLDALDFAEKFTEGFNGTIGSMTVRLHGNED